MAQVVAHVTCSGRTHRIALIGSETEQDIVLIDHDEAADAVLSALGGEPTACEVVARAWRKPAWSDAVACLLRDDESAATYAAGHAVILARTDDTTSPAAASVALLRLPSPFRRACGERGLAALVEAWRAGDPPDGLSRALLNRQLEPVVTRKLVADGLILQRLARPVRVRVIGPGRPPRIWLSRGAWEVRVPIDSVAWLSSAADGVRRWLEGVDTP